MRRQEQDPERQAALEKVELQMATRLGRRIDAFLDSCKPVPYGAGVASEPGAYSTIVEAFSLAQAVRGARHPEAVAHAASVVLEKISWCLTHADQIIHHMAKKNPRARTD